MIQLLIRQRQGAVASLDRSNRSWLMRATRLVRGGPSAAPEYEGGGKVVFIEKENGEVEVTTLRRSLKRAQDLVRHYIPNGAGTVDEFIAERRAEAERETEAASPSPAK